MKKKIYLEPRKTFDKAIIAENTNDITYCFYIIQEILMEQFEETENEDALIDIATEWFWYNIEPLSNYYNIKFKYKINKTFLIKIFNYKEKNEYEYLKSDAYPGEIIYSCKDSANAAIKRIKNNYHSLTRFVVEERDNEY